MQELRTQGQVNEQVEAQAKQIVDSALVLLWKWMSDADNNVYVDSHCEQSPCDTYIHIRMDSASVVLGFVHEYLNKVKPLLRLALFSGSCSDTNRAWCAVETCDDSWE